ncbi:Hsp20/alpha crystallin family protein [Halomarina rubra]|uniref:Hsp20/alpha crystallin family protein n=1 Tax=Halomarina rubra TaxID=2071873 RepID=A0ABD6AWE2_9EURY|nr:Hsp20/alpha crystallin family protein [Halomarina rubra]
MSARRNPFEELERVFERMRQEFDRNPERWMSIGSGEKAESESMALDLVEHDEEFIVTVDLPGYESDDVDVRITDSMLRIRAERSEEHEEEEEQFIHHERRHESATRAVRLPGAVDKDAVNARMNNGVLTITLPRIEEDKARRIDVK